MFCNMFVLVTDYTLRNIVSANDQGIVAVTGRAHCQRQVAFFKTIENCESHQTSINNNVYNKLI